MSHHIFNHASPAEVSALLDQLNSALKLPHTSVEFLSRFQFPEGSDESSYKAFINEAATTQNRLMVCQMLMLRPAFYSEAYSAAARYGSAALSLIYEANTSESILEQLSEACKATGLEAIKYRNLKAAFTAFYNPQSTVDCNSGAPLVKGLRDVLLSSTTQRELYQACCSACRLITNLGLNDGAKPHLQHVCDLFGVDKSACLPDCIEHYQRVAAGL